MSPMVKLPLTIEHALLGFLREQPMHAYEIHQTLRRPEALGLVWRLKQSIVYVMLERLEEEGYLSTTLEPQQSRPPRKLLHLTEAGREAFERWRVTPVEHGRDFRIEFLAKLYFANQDNPTTVAHLLAAQRAACREWRDSLHHQAEQLPQHDYDWLVLQFRIGQLDAIMNWLDICETTATPSLVT
jgi:PadR family transcriptional regulator AphA